MKMLSLNKDTKILRYQNKVIYANSSNGKWLRVSSEVADILSEY